MITIKCIRVSHQLDFFTYGSFFVHRFSCIMTISSERAHAYSRKGFYLFFSSSSKIACVCSSLFLSSFHGVYVDDIQHKFVIRVRLAIVCKNERKRENSRHFLFSFLFNYACFLQQKKSIPI